MVVWLTLKLLAMASQTFPVDVPSPDNLADLTRGQFWFPAQLHAIPHGAGSAFASARSN
jgi:hypothetical protein